MTDPNILSSTHNDNITLRDFVFALMRESDLRWSQRFEAQQEALRVAVINHDKMLDERVKFYNDKFESQTAAMHTAIMNSKEAVAKADAATEKRFDSVNEFRGQMSDMQSGLMPRSETESQIKSISEKIDSLQTRIDKSEGSGYGVKQSWTVLVGGLAALATVVAVYSALAKPPAPDAVAAAATAQLQSRMDALSARLNSQPSLPAQK